jgi:hypothetical protein
MDVFVATHHRGQSFFLEGVQVLTKSSRLLLVLIFMLPALAFAAVSPADRTSAVYAPVPPMGWNSWDSYGT